ncbi:MAG TPA: ATP-binding protein [Pyrinomonadaceae bacterium]|nr:ATP-binding protein [Pyrinomonadaceae bacterium]
MNDGERWQLGNEQYLAAALAWLRLRLERAASNEQSEPPVADSLGEPEPPRRRLFRRSTEAAHHKPSVPLLGPANISEEQIESAATAMNAAESELDPPPALSMLAQRFGLSEFERNVLLLCAAMELDTRAAVLCDYAQGGQGRKYPTFALAFTLFDSPSWDVLSHERPLRRWHLIEINQPGGSPLTSAHLSIDEWILNYLKGLNFRGLNYVDDRLAPLLLPLQVPPATVGLPPSQREQVEYVVRSLQQTGEGERLPVTQLLGSDAQSKQLVAAYAAAGLGLHVYRLPARQLPSQAAELETFARLWQRQSVLLPVCLYLDALETETAATGEGREPELPPLGRFLTRSDGVFFLDTRDPWPRLDRATVTLDVTKPTPAEQKAAWAVVLGEEAGDSPARLSGQFSLSLSEIARIAASTLAAGEEETRPLGERLWDAALASTRPRLDALAQRIEAKATWENIVLPEADAALLRQIADQVAQRATVYDEWGFRETSSRGLSLTVLFTGQSGTGKTMAAEVLANELRLNLYRIDLSAVVSKYIGETEKNLRRVFDSAEEGGALLFFDEADAIFGKRTDVKDAHDRYANIETNYLLQRLESYRGLAILATNMNSALDPAFMRRMRYVLDFKLPGPAERERIWRKVFPPGVPLGELDFARLARLGVAGGDIFNIALNAAFLAANQGRPVTMPLILGAARTELRKLGRPVNEADLRWEEERPAVA